MGGVSFSAVTAVDKEIGNNNPIVFETVTVNHGLGYNSGTGKPSNIILRGLLHALSNIIQGITHKVPAESTF